MSPRQRSKGDGRGGQSVAESVLIDLEGCSVPKLIDPGAMEAVLKAVALKLESQIVGWRLHTFPDPGGFTAIALLELSHISVHTWPEHSYVAVDVLTCGPPADAEALVNLFASSVGSKSARYVRHARPLSADRTL